MEVAFDTSPGDPLVAWEADEVVRRWRAFEDGADAVAVPHHRLARDVLNAAPLHLRGQAHAQAVSAALRCRGYAAALQRTARFIGTSPPCPISPE